jgi:1,4-alpha-glucan branching enzyme
LTSIRLAQTSVGQSVTNKRAVGYAQFNSWKPTGHKMDGPDEQGRFTTRLELKRGRYEYKYVLEGKTWRHDPGNPQQAGYFNNSVLVLPETEAERGKRSVKAEK